MLMVAIDAVGCSFDFPAFLMDNLCTRRGNHSGLALTVAGPFRSDYHRGKGFKGRGGYDTVAFKCQPNHTRGVEKSAFQVVSDLL